MRMIPVCFACFPIPKKTMGLFILIVSGFQNTGDTVFEIRELRG